jgi:hypothetical protein
MSDATEYRPGDIAMVDSVVCLWRDHDQSQLKPAGWYDLRGLLMPYHGRQVVGPIIGNVADIADGTAVDLGWQAAHAATIQIQQLQRWKTEAMEVMEGLQQLGDALHLRLGERITGPAALEAVQKLRTAAQAFLDAYDNVGVEVWWPEESDALREVLGHE